MLLFLHNDIVNNKEKIAMTKFVYIHDNVIRMELSPDNKNNAIVVLNGEVILDKQCVHFLKSSLDNTIYCYRSINEHEEFMVELKKEIVRESKTFTLTYSNELMDVLYPKKKEKVPTFEFDMVV